MAILQISLFGSPSIKLDGVNLSVDTRKAIALLVYLVMTQEQHSRDTLATLLWPDYGQVNARSALRRTLSVLQKALGGEFLSITREMIGIDRDEQIEADVLRFRQHLAAVTKHSHRSIEYCIECLVHLDAAIDIYQGDFLVGFTLRDSPNFDEWQFYESEALKRELNDALEIQVKSKIGAGDYSRALNYTQRWLTLDPLREDVHRTLMLIFAWTGQRNAALRQYRECVRVLDRELGVPPLEETTQLYQAIAENHLPEPPSVSRKQINEDTLGIVQDRDSRLYAPNITTALLQGKSYPLVGRSRESEILEKAYREYASIGYLFIIEGEAGIGKTRLADAFLASAKARGARVMKARSYAGEENLAYGPVIACINTALDELANITRLREISQQSLSESARLIPELNRLIPGLPAPPPLSTPGAQMRFYDGIRQLIINLLSGSIPGIIFLDDLHWADSASLDLITYLIRRLGGYPVFILTTWTDHNIPDSVQQVIAEAEQSGTAARIHLGRLKESDVIELVRASAKPEELLPDQLGTRLFRETEGLPFFVIEYLEAIQTNQSSYQQSYMEEALPSIDEWSMPQAVRDALLARLSAAGETGWQILSTAAVIGRSFDFDTILAASGRSESETVTALEKLIAMGLIEEQQVSQVGTIVYDFTHDKLRRLAYDETSLTRRRLIHRRVADTLSTQLRHRSDPFVLASQVAQQYHLGGQDAQAAEYYKLAGEHARRLYANQEAISNFQAALSAGHSEVALLHESIGDLRTLQGDYRSALTEYETAASLMEQSPYLEQKIGNLHHRRGDWDLAACHYQLALDSLDTSENLTLRARIYADWSLTAYQQGNDKQALEYAQQALALAEQAGYDPALASAHNILGILSRRNGMHTEAVRHLEKSLESANRLIEPAAQVAALNNLALVYQDIGSYQRAIQYAHQALELCKIQGDRHREAALLNHLADFYHSSGNNEMSLAYLKQAVIIFSEIGVAGGDIQPEIWKLTEW